MVNTSVNVTLVRNSFRDIYGLFPRVEQHEIRPPEGLLYVAASLEKCGHHVTVIDNEVLGLNDDELITKVKTTDPEFVGMAATTPEFPHVAKLLESIKKELGIITIIGGPHPSADSENVLTNHPGIDFVVRGEGEITTAEVIDNYSNGVQSESILGLAFRRNGKVVINPNRPFICNLDDIPSPARHLIDSEKYYYPLRGHGMEKVATMITSRGCPYHCIFCYSMHGHRVRYRSILNVIQELESIIETYGIRYFIFHDECFTLSRDRVMEFCNEMLNRKLDVHWFCFTRGDAVDQEMADRMAEAGCVKISLGVESGSQAMLERAGKRTQLDNIEGAFRILHRAGIETRGSFIIGLPGEDSQSIQQTIDYAKSLKMCHFGLNIATPYPGTKMWDMAEAQDGIRFDNTDLSAFRRWGNAVVATNALSSNDLVQAQRKALINFYLRPKILWFFLREWLKGNRATYYYRPLLFAIRESFRNFRARFK